MNQRKKIYLELLEQKTVNLEAKIKELETKPANALEEQIDKICQEIKNSLELLNDGGYS